MIMEMINPELWNENSIGYVIKFEYLNVAKF